MSYWRGRRGAPGAHRAVHVERFQERDAGDDGRRRPRRRLRPADGPGQPRHRAHRLGAPADDRCVLFPPGHDAGRSRAHRCGHGSSSTPVMLPTWGWPDDNDGRPARIPTYDRTQGEPASTRPPRRTGGGGSSRCSTSGPTPSGRRRSGCPRARRRSDRRRPHRPGDGARRLPGDRRPPPARARPPAQRPPDPVPQQLRGRAASTSTTAAGSTRSTRCTPRSPTRTTRPPRTRRPAPYLVQRASLGPMPTTCLRSVCASARSRSPVDDGRPRDVHVLPAAGRPGRRLPRVRRGLPRRGRHPPCPHQGPRRQRRRRPGHGRLLPRPRSTRSAPTRTPPIPTPRPTSPCSPTSCSCSMPSPPTSRPGTSACGRGARPAWPVVARPHRQQLRAAALPADVHVAGGAGRDHRCHDDLRRRHEQPGADVVGAQGARAVPHRPRQDAGRSATGRTGARPRRPGPVPLRSCLLRPAVPPRWGHARVAPRQRQDRRDRRRPRRMGRARARHRRQRAAHRRRRPLEPVGVVLAGHGLP